jgi:hypothetical protein
LRMHIIAVGPTGTAIANPIISPFKKTIGSMLSCPDQLVAVDTVRKVFQLHQRVLFYTKSFSIISSSGALPFL